MYAVHEMIENLSDNIVMYSGNEKKWSLTWSLNYGQRKFILSER